MTLFFIKRSRLRTGQKSLDFKWSGFQMPGTGIRSNPNTDHGYSVVHCITCYHSIYCIEQNGLSRYLATDVYQHSGHLNTQHAQYLKFPDANFKPDRIQITGIVMVSTKHFIVYKLFWTYSVLENNL
jgi:hypothetical protein